MHTNRMAARYGPLSPSVERSTPPRCLRVIAFWWLRWVRSTCCMRSMPRTAACFPGTSATNNKEVTMWDQFIIYPFTNVLLWIYDIIGHNFGIAIILFTILIRLVTWPLNAQQLKSAKVMQDLQKDKECQAIHKKHAKDAEKKAQEQMRIYKERGISPFASCIPTIIQF